MALNRKKSRPIEVNGVVFRYVVSAGPDDGNGEFPLTLIVQNQTGEGAYLRATGVITRNHWLDCPNAREEGAYQLILPSHVSATIEEALIRGWVPTERGREFRCEITKLPNQQMHTDQPSAGR